MRIWVHAAIAACAAMACDTKHLAVDTTSQILVRGQPAIQQESDYELAARAIPSSLKAVESFHAAYPDIRRLTALLAEGYCQYGSGFVEDEWEIAFIDHGDLAQADPIARRASKMYVRCMNYALELLGPRWTEAMNGGIQELRAVARSAGPGDREAMMWLALGLASLINMNLEAIDVVSYLPYAQFLLERLVVMDGDAAMLARDGRPLARVTEEFGKGYRPPRDPLRHAMPHIALGMLFTSRGKAIGGDPERGRRHFERAIELTGGRFLLAKVLFAKNYGRASMDRTRFRDLLVEVLQTDPAIWPEQRLANEIAVRRARRYLRHEAEWF